MVSGLRAVAGRHQSFSVRIPVTIAGGFGPDTVVVAIKAVGPAGVDSKTKTDKDDGSHTKDLEKVRQFVSLAKLRRGEG